ncbi:MAG: Rne/Rng family ribonuclease, partial [Acidobacteria bacterium]|nr:Rne/Rng family ribonuclease [Acidobacteriota bacterium]
MQSAFVNIGLERDAFLYVSDFLEQVEEYDRVATAGEDRETSRRATRKQESEEETPPTAAAPAATTSPSVEEPPPVESQPAPAFDVAPKRAPARPERFEPRPEPREAAPGPGGKPNRFSRRSRRHRGRHRGLPESKYARTGVPPLEESQAPEPMAVPAAPVLLPGESFAKYSDRGAPPELSEEQASQPSVESAEIGGEQIQEPVTFLGGEIMPDTTGEKDRPQVSGAPQPEVLPREPSVEMLAAPALSTESDSEAEVSQDFLAVEQAVEAVREEKMIEELEDEAAEIAESETPHAEKFDAAADLEETPPWELLHDRVLDTIDDAEPDSPETEAQEMPAESAGSPAVSSEELGAPGEVGSREAAEAPRQAAVRERPFNPRFQRRQRWAARKQQRGDQGRPRPRTSDRETPKPLIGDMLKEGQEIIVQIAKEPLGRKGARITSHIALPGRYIVYMPTLDHTGVSRKISSDEERHRLKRIIVEHTRNLSGGFIVRTAGEGHSEEDLRQDVQFLVNLWAEIKAKAERPGAPMLLHHDLDLTLRTLRDQLSDEFQTIWVDNEQAYEQIVSLVQKFQPALVHRVRLFTKDVPLFEETGVQDEINKALKPKVWLKSGGYIVINQTEALVAIDVNTGKFVGKSNRLEDTIVKTNVEAIQEIVRQIRLRDLGGIIVIDFIDMDERRNRQKVLTALEEALRADKAPSKILAFNEFGLIAITRKRVR